MIIWKSNRPCGPEPLPDSTFQGLIWGEATTDMGPLGRQWVFGGFPLSCGTGPGPNWKISGKQPTKGSCLAPLGHRGASHTR